MTATRSTPQKHFRHNSGTVIHSYSEAVKATSLPESHLQARNLANSKTSAGSNCIPLNTVLFLAIQIDHVTANHTCLQALFCSLLKNKQSWCIKCDRVVPGLPVATPNQPSHNRHTSRDLRHLHMRCSDVSSAT